MINFGKLLSKQSRSAAALFFRHFEDEDGMTDEDSVTHARSLAQRKKKKKRSHIRFCVTILDTGNESANPSSLSLSDNNTGWSIWSDNWVALTFFRGVPPTSLLTCSTSFANLPSAHVEPGRRQNKQNQSQPNASIQPDGPPFTWPTGHWKNMIFAQYGT